MKGLVFDVQRYSIHDGPGIRTVVFLKGCPLHCLWCCNPESQSMNPELEFRHSLCEKCGKCIPSCPENAIHPDVNTSPLAKVYREKCTVCGECVKVCPNDALRINGKWMESKDVFDECLKDAGSFRRSGGGVTLSGGEPLFQPEFTLELLRFLYERNIHTTLETTGFAAWEMIEPMLPFIDLFLFDIKQVDSNRHSMLTGVPNEEILANLESIARNSKQIILRVPFIPGFTDDREDLEAIAALASRLSIKEIHIMPFHQFGKEKYARFGYQYSLNDLTGVQDTEAGRKSLLATLKSFTDSGIRTTIGG